MNCKTINIRKCVAFMLLILVVFQMTSCSSGSEPEVKPEVKTDYGSSEIYSKEDMDVAIKVIEDEFDTWKGFELHSITYSGDENCNKRNAAYVNQLREAKNVEEVLTQCIVFKSGFHTPPKTDGGFNANEEYTDWQWWLGRAEGGDWELMAWGY